MNIKAYIFDLDGTLVDTEPLYIQAAIDALAEKGAVITRDEAFNLVHGHAWSLIYRTSQERYPGTWPEAEEMWRFVENRAVELSRSFDISIASSIETLLRLAKDTPVAVVSGSPREKIERNLIETGVDAVVEFFMGCEDYEHSKPHPEPFLLAADKLGVAPSECLVFEDSPAGVESAKAAGMHVVVLSSDSTNEIFADTAAVLESLSHYDIDELYKQ